MLYGISEQYTYDIVTLIYDQCFPLHAKPVVFVLRLFLLLLIQ